MEKSENQYLLGSPEKEMSPYIVIRVAAFYMIVKSSDFPIIYKLSRRRILQSRILILELQKIYRSMNKMIHVKHTESVVNSFHCKTEGVYPYQHY